MCNCTYKKKLFYIYYALFLTFKKFNLQMNFSQEFIQKFEKCSKNEQKKYLDKLCNKYHIQKQLKNHFLAVDELAFRLVYEVLTHKISYETVVSGRWSHPTLRDNGHHIRIKKLQCYIRKSPIAMEYVSSFKWLKI